MSGIPDGFRADGRKSKELRPIQAKVGLLKDVQCSALYQAGLTKVLCSIRGPFSSVNAKRSFVDSGFIAVHFEVGNASRYKQYESVIQSYMTSILDLDEFPLTVMEVIIVPICNDGSLLAASINAATLAVMHGGIPHKSVGLAVSIGVADKPLPPCPSDKSGEDRAILIDLLASEEAEEITEDTRLQYGATYILDSDCQECWGIWPEVGSGVTLSEMQRMAKWAEEAGGIIGERVKTVKDAFEKAYEDLAQAQNTLLISDSESEVEKLEPGEVVDVS
eukprot:Blabericola_migrator_1__11654@NODE_701_length_6815_cov_211_000445_g510_i0_p4_GENE_NODE_701_length_6815_cov_211_000445_g510_i0NODE_701_length_6815_cov_211_000445_g510_i0_p4_ORF_typecomplete_len277_score43_49RNase_PH/PF01138_21/2_4e16_NODE_701_length_6815_cov_211_000445_g510_i012592089